MTGGTANFNCLDLPLSQLIISGATAVVKAGGHITVSDKFIFSSGLLTGIGVTTVLGTLQLDSSASKYLDEHTLISNGTSSWSGGNIVLSDNATIINTLTGQMTVLSSSYSISGIGTARFINYGQVAKTAAGPSNISVDFLNYGLVSVSNGAMNLYSAKEEILGTFVSNFPGLLRFTAPFVAFMPSVHLTGNGSIEFVNVVDLVRSLWDCVSQHTHTPHTCLYD